MNNLDKQYQTLLQTILDFGVEKKDRTGTGTKSIFGYTIRHNMKDGFPLLTTKKMAWKTMVTELLWFLRGDTNIKFLVDNNCHIWDGDAYKNFVSNIPYKTYVEDYLTQEEFINKIKTDDEFAKKWGELGPVYGKQWRSWKIGERKLKWSQLNDEQKLSISKEKLENTHIDVPVFTEEKVIDQIQNLINDLKTNPDSRRLMVNAWNVGELDQMVLPPCHYGFQVYTRELSDEERLLYCLTNIDTFILPTTEEELNELNVPKRAISLMWNQRSVDTFLGLPFNIASYGLLLEIIAKAVNMVPDELIGNLGDVHLYSNHIEQAKEQIGRELTYKERYKIWFQNNFESGFEYNDDIVIDFDNPYFEPTPTHTREPYPLPALKIESEVKWADGDCLPTYSVNDFVIDNYQSHPTIKAPLSN